MQSNQLRAIQAPLKEQYRQEPGVALVTLSAQGSLGEGVTCKIETGKAMAQAGLHPATGGDGLSVCSGDMLLEALVACAGVTLSGGQRHRHPGSEWGGAGRGRAGFPWYLGGQQRCAGRVPAYPPLFRPRQRCQ
jgi:hypothetical protein